MKLFTNFTFAINVGFVILSCAALCASAASVNCGGDAAARNASETTSEKEGEHAVAEEPSIDEAASDSSSKPTSSPTATEVKKFIQTVQNTLEKAKPLVDEFEKEAKRFEETAKRFGEGVLKGLNQFVDRLIGTNDGNPSILSSLLGGGHTQAGSSSSGASAGDSDDDGGSDNDGDNSSSSSNLSIATETVDQKKEHESTTTKADVVAVEVAIVTEAADPLDNEIIPHQDGIEEQQICPDGFRADVNRICQRIKY